MVHRRPIIHGRDHAHGGADPVHVAWEDVGSGGGAGGGAAGAWCVGVRDTNQSVPSGPSTLLTFNHFYTTDPAVFASAPGGVPGDSQIKCLGAGTYLAISSVQFGGSGFARYANIEGGTAVPGPGWFDLIVKGSQPNTDNTTTIAPSGGSFWLSDFHVAAHDPVGGTGYGVFQVRLLHANASAVNVQGRLAVLYWPLAVSYQTVY